MISGFDPRLPALLWGWTAVLSLAAALHLWSAAPYSRLSAVWRRAPRMVGAVGGGMILTVGWWLVQALQLTEVAALLPMLVATLLALILGIYLPGLPARAFARRRERLLLQTIDLVGYVQFAVASSQGDADLLRTYIRRPQRPIADVQAVVGAALAEIEQRRRGNVFAVLLDHAVETGSQPLMACCTALFHGAQNSRRALGPVLAQQREQLFDILVETCKQRAQRLELLLIGISAAALAFGLLPGILFVMTGGGAAFGNLF